MIAPTFMSVDMVVVEIWLIKVLQSCDTVTKVMHVLGARLLTQQNKFVVCYQREIFEDQQEITTVTVIWARQLVSPQPKLGPNFSL